MADFRRFWTGAGCPKWRQDGRTWRQDGANMAQDGACLAILRPIGKYLWHFWGSWGRSLQKWPKCKSEHHYGVLATFSGLGESCWKPWGLSWKVLARSWGVLGDLGLNLGPFWQHVGTKMAKMSQDRRTWLENGWLWAMRYGDARPGARRGVPRA